MKTESVMNKLQEIFRDIFDDETLNIDRNTSAENIEAWDSLAHINLIVAIENEFRIKFALGELQNMKNTGDLLDAIIEKST